MESQRWGLLPEEFQEDELERVVRNFFGESSRLVTASCKNSGLFNTTYDLVTSGGEEVILRISPPEDYPQLFYEKGMMADEPAVHELVLSRTSLPIPRIWLYDPSRMILPREYILMEKKNGRPLEDLQDFLDPEKIEKILTLLGRYTRELHSIQGERFGYMRTIPVMEVQDSWRKAFVIMLDMILSDSRRAGAYDEHEANVLLAAFLENEMYLEKNSPAALLHLDFWQQNILVNERSEITGLLDFDRAAWGDVELEFAVLDICGLSQRAFFEGYGGFRPGDERAIRRNALYLIYEYLKYVFTNWTPRGSKPTSNYFKREIDRIVKSILLRPHGHVGV